MSPRCILQSRGLFRRALVPTALVSSLQFASAGMAQDAATDTAAQAIQEVSAEASAESASEPAREAPVERVETRAVQLSVPEPVAAPQAEAEVQVPKADAAPEAADEEADAWAGAVRVSGYVEAYYSHNFGKPENKTAGARWLDEQSGQFTLQTVALDVAAQKGPFSAQLTLMFGPTADRWYFEGAAIKATEDDVLLPENRWSNETWKHIQTAYVGYEAPVGNGLLVQGGLFPTQVGYEPAAVKDNGNFSRSNLFAWLPFFHVGVRATYPVTEKFSVMGAVYNGYNQLKDLNKNKSVSLQGSYVADDWFLNLLYIGGVERPAGDVAGDPWRHLFDAVSEYSGFERLTLAAHASAGFENSAVGDNRWLGGALYARLKAFDWFYLALRGDGLKEFGNGAADAPMLFGPGHLLSATATAEFRPLGDGFSLRVEYRHDDADKDNPMYYRRGLAADGSQRLAATQNTLTVGVTGWF